MADTEATLAKLVALKRQRAEQRVFDLQQAVDDARAKLADLEARLVAMDADVDANMVARLLAFQQGHVEKLVADIKAQRGTITDAEAELEAARAELRSVFHSEDQLADQARRKKA